MPCLCLPVTTAKVLKPFEVRRCGACISTDTARLSNRHLRWGGNPCIDSQSIQKWKAQQDHVSFSKNALTVSQLPFKTYTMGANDIRNPWMILDLGVQLTISTSPRLAQRSSSKLTAPTMWRSAYTKCIIVVKPPWLQLLESCPKNASKKSGSYDILIIYDHRYHQNDHFWGYPFKNKHMMGSCWVVSLQSKAYLPRNFCWSLYHWSQCRLNISLTLSEFTPWWKYLGNIDPSMGADELLSGNLT